MHKFIWVVIALLSLVGCATGRLSDEERLQLYRANAGAPVRDFRYGNSLAGWTALGGNALAVWTRPNQAYLLELRASCNELGYAPAIAITQRFGQVSARFDNVIALSGPGMIRIPCRIETIRPLDVKAIRASEKQLREARMQERTEAEAGETQQD
ncbi:DUF6491 family protein [Xanthomonas campestris]|uniref:DUF6491 family protein n=1 Tax=Xanthomonas campestris TaxID=339 RepID=UPI0015F28352|nr:DUF6491 family protein [Xanthomonas campestris]MEA9489265.1 DUF6491 family protein [Xanthomonas campestris]MEA9508867.1 DUF6491 family protein [Xanthomonas campestris]MEA9575228.1 DUF6491 family protein [Xanthomonas campestris]